MRITFHIGKYTITIRLEAALQFREGSQKQRSRPLWQVNGCCVILRSQDTN